jgi:hypothetical protein
MRRCIAKVSKSSTWSERSLPTSPPCSGDREGVKPSCEVAELSRGSQRGLIVTIAVCNVLSKTRTVLHRSSCFLGTRLSPRERCCTFRCSRTPLQRQIINLSHSVSTVVAVHLIGSLPSEVDEPSFGQDTILADRFSGLLQIDLDTEHRHSTLIAIVNTSLTIDNPIGSCGISGISRYI